MVNVFIKINMLRVVVVSGCVFFGFDVFFFVVVNNIVKGDVFIVVKIVGIMGVK